MAPTDPMSEHALRDQLAAEYLEKVLAQAGRWAHRRPDLREDFEEAALAALTRSLQGNFRAKSNFSTYVYRAVENAILMVLRARRRRREINLETQDITSLYDRRHPAHSPEDAEGEGSTTNERMWRVLARIAQPRDRQILWLADGLNLELSEIRQILNVSLGTVKARLHRARLNAQSCARVIFPELANWEGRKDDEIY